MNADIFNYAVGIIGTILGIVGIVLSVKSIKKKVPTYSIKSVNVISDYTSKYENLAVSYKDKIVENFTVSKVLFYNRGSETITKQDIDTIAPLKISSETCDILDASILQVNKTSNNFRINLDRGKEYVYIGFDYLDKNQGAVIQVVHTGLSSDDLVLEGDIKGVQKLYQVQPESLIKNIKLSPNATRFVWIAIFFALIFWFEIGNVRLLMNSGNFIFMVASFVVIILGGTATLMPIFLIIDGIRQSLFSNRVIPKDLENFFE